MIEKPGSLRAQIAKYLSDPLDFPLEFTAWLRSFLDEPSNYTRKIANTVATTGLLFNDDNQGGYLDIVTNAADAAGIGTKIYDTTGGAKAIAISPLNSGTMRLGDSSQCAGIEMQATLITVGGGTVTTTADLVQLATTNGATSEIKITLAHTSTKLTVLDHLGNAIFRIDENGDLHGKTAKALTFDL